MTTETKSPLRRRLLAGIVAVAAIAGVLLALKLGRSDAANPKEWGTGLVSHRFDGDDGSHFVAACYCRFELYRDSTESHRQKCHLAGPIVILCTDRRADDRSWTVGLSVMRSDGPWVTEEGEMEAKGVFQYSHGTPPVKLGDIPDGLDATVHGDWSYKSVAAMILAQFFESTPGIDMRSKLTVLPHGK